MNVKLRELMEVDMMAFANDSSLATYVLMHGIALIYYLHAKMDTVQQFIQMASNAQRSQRLGSNRLCLSESRSLRLSPSSTRLCESPAGNNGLGGAVFRGRPWRVETSRPGG